MDYLLDFSMLIHSLISQPKLNHRALILLADNSSALSALYLSVLSSWEIEIKAGAGRLVLPERPAEFVTRATRFISLKPRILLISARWRWVAESSLRPV